MDCNYNSFDLENDGLSDATLAALHHRPSWEAIPIYDQRTIGLEIANTVLPVFRSRSNYQRRTVIDSDQAFRFNVWCIALALSLVFLFVDLNATSMHRFYRNGISRRFIAAPDENEFSPKLSELTTCAHGGPYHLINCSSSTPLLPWQYTGGTDSNMPDLSVSHFLFSHLACGTKASGYSTPSDFQSQLPRKEGRTDLSEATSLSGAAISPTYQPGSLLAALTFVLNLRLGQWLPVVGNGKHFMYPNFAVLFRDMFRNPGKRKLNFVSDGGHTENLGLMPLLERRCRIIFCVDAGADPTCRFEELAKVVRICRAVHGIRFLQVDSDAEVDQRYFGGFSKRENSKGGDKPQESSLGTRHFAIARVQYPSEERDFGLLIYLKPSMTGDEPIDVAEFANRNGEFPHDPTGDQFFESDQVEAYRKLGKHSIESILKGWSSSGSTNASLTMSKLLQELQAGEFKIVGEVFPSFVEKEAVPRTVLTTENDSPLPVRIIGDEPKLAPKKGKR